MKKKFLCLFLILSICTFTLTGCYDATGIENLSYAIAIGLDKGENNVLSLSVQFAIPTSGSESSEGSSQSNSTTITSIECSSLSSGINLINSYLSKQVNLAHCKVIVISEELAEEGIAEYIYTFVDNVQVRPNCNIIITRCDAINFLENAKPTLEKLTARYYEAAINSSEYTAYTADIQLKDFYSALKSEYIQPSAILAGVNTPQTHLSSSDIDKFNIDSSYKANETPVKDKTNLECMGLAVFNKDKLVGELDGIESLCYSITSDRLDNCMITISNPMSPDKSVDIYLNKIKNSHNNVEFINDSPYITVKVFLEGYIISSDEDSEHSTHGSLETINESAIQYLESQISSFLYKTSKELKSDIVGYGRYAMNDYLTSEEWQNSGWLDNYQNAFFDVEVSINLKSGELFSKM